MNTYSKVLKHISIKDVKRKHQEKIIEKIHEEMRKKEERQYIQSVMKNKKYDWRKEVNEGMTSSGTFLTTLPATGDTNLAFPSWNVFGGQGFSVSGTNLAITTSGVQEDEIAGTNGTIARFDTSFSNTIIFNVSISGNAVLGVFDIQSNLLLLAQSSGTYSINVTQSSELQLLFGSPSNTIGTVNINNTRLRRTIPLNVFVPLDSPEAASFIRTDPMMSNLSPTERLKNLQKMLDASDEYVEKILGKNFPGTGTRPAETIMPNSWETAQLSPGTERSIDSMLLKGLQRGDYGTGPDVDKQIRNLQQNMRNNTPGGRGLQVQTGQNTQVAHYEPQGQLISEKKLKSPEEVLNKIPGYYDGKPAPLGFPIESPPEMKNGMHPDLVDGKQIANRFNRLDPQSAEAMPLTGNPEIDKRIKKARKQPK